MQQNREDHFLSKNILLILCLIFLLAIISGTIAIYFYSSTFNGDITKDYNRWGALGDFFGGILNPIFSFLALFALLLTIILQNKELSISTNEFKKSAEALTEQSKSIKIQVFESTFFRLVSLHNEIVNSLEFFDKEKRQCFDKYIGMLRLNKTGTEETDEKRKYHDISEVYNRNYKLIATSVEHYHKNLYQIILFTDKNGPKDNRKQYTNFIRSQLSRSELHLLFLHGLSKYGYEKFKIFIEKYEMLEHLPVETFLLKENMHLYSKSAFGKNIDLINLYEKQNIS